MIKIEATRRFREALDSSFLGNGNFDYKYALSKSIMFFEGQRSSVLPPNQILTWRKDSALTDGFDQNVGVPNTDHDCWERPEDMDTSHIVYRIDTQNPGSDVAGETVAAMAVASIVF